MKIKIWLPESVYRCFPFGCLLAGILFSLIASGPGWAINLILSMGLIAYGVVVIGARASYRNQ